MGVTRWVILVSQRSRRIAGRSICSTKRACESMKMEKTPMEIQSIKSYLCPNQRRFHIHMERHPLRFSPAYFSYGNGPNDPLLSELKKSIAYNRTERRVVSTLSSLEIGTVGTWDWKHIPSNWNPQPENYTWSLRNTYWFCSNKLLLLVLQLQFLFRKLPYPNLLKVGGKCFNKNSENILRSGW